MAKKQQPEKTPKWLRITGWVILGLNALCMINSAWFFMGQAKFPFLGWIFFNACFVAALIWIAGFVFRFRWLTAASLPFLLFFGGGGLLFFPWTGYMITAQISHIVMMIAFIHAIVDAFSTRGWKQEVFGLIGGILVFTGFMFLQQSYTRKHPELWERMGMPAYDVESGATSQADSLKRAE
ncbi:hypothetical protein JXM67_01405 [candidate division WOR-3 bacterium]|nr:hypothetical protein [candidate division WOR-3 bacterium]